ncbi:MAG: hypothetical protein DMD60_03855 [Gemmatimonadetes bacterium]|nr:MAG: hypothetical protein DMD60_03855 [Gemmatimonadota bacterium]
MSARWRAGAAGHPHEPADPGRHAAAPGSPERRRRCGARPRASLPLPTPSGSGARWGAPPARRTG